MSDDDLDKRLAAALARKADRDAVDAAKAERASTERRVLGLERDEAVIEALAAAGGAIGRDLLRVDIDHADGTPIGAVLVRGPKMATWRGYLVQRENTKGVERDALDEKMWRQCLAWPEPPKVDAYVAAQPFFRDRMLNAIATLAGVRDEAVAGKS